MPPVWIREEMKRDPALIPLSYHHHHGLVAARRVSEKLLADIDDSAVATLGHQVKMFHDADLESHFAAEETWLLPEIVDPEPELVARTRNEHAELRELAKSLGTSASREALARWSELLRSHIRFEERVLFERAQELLPPDTLRAVGAHLLTLSREPHLPGEPARPS